MVNIYEILQKIGFDWQVALANLFNFLLILFLLKKFAFKPVSKMIQDRQDRINEGLQKASEAEIRLKEVDEIAKGILKKSQQESLSLIEDTQKRAKELEDSLAKKADERHRELIKQIESEYRGQQEASRQNILKEATDLVKKIISKTVELSPESIDDALIGKAISKISKE